MIGFYVTIHYYVTVGTGFREKPHKQTVDLIENESIYITILWFFKCYSTK